MVKNPPANAGDIRDIGLIPGSERSPGGGHDTPVQYSCLETPMDRGAWHTTVSRVAKSHTRLSDFHSLSGHVTRSRISGSSGIHMTRFSR